MKYIVFTYNMLTLCRALGYTNELWGKENTIIIYTNLVSPLPMKIQQDYKVHFIESDRLDDARGVKAIVKSCFHTKKIWRLLDSSIQSFSDEFKLIVFRDNEIQEATMIDNVIKKYKNRATIYLLEEGSGIYAHSRISTRYVIIKKIFYTLFNVSQYSLSNKSQGLNPKVKKIICLQPMMIKEKNCNVDTEQMIHIFTEEFNSYIIEAVMGKRIESKKFDYVFLTQPFTDFRADFPRVLDAHEKLLPQVFEVLCKYGNTIIKLHPREKFNYSRYIQENISVSSDQEKMLPFECIMQLYGNPQMISMYSSTSINYQTSKPSIYLCKLFKIPGTENLFSSEFFLQNNIKCCENLNEFPEMLVKKKEN